MFYYVEKFEKNLTCNAQLVTINKSVDSKEALLRQFSDSLHFPDYFGYNFDALYDLLRDLSWLQQKEIIVWHDGLPLLEESVLAVYLDLLNQVDVEWEQSAMRAEIIKKYMRSRGEVVSSDSWLYQEPKTFNVYFRLEDKEYVETLLERYSRDYRKCIHYDERGVESIDKG